MSPRRAIGTVVAALLVTALALVGVPAGAQDAAGPVEVTVDQVGWWTSRVGATAADEGGFEVATDGAGEPESIAAVQLTIDATTVDGFTISLTESSALAEFGSIAVCHVVGLWMPENPGDLDSAPATDCSTRVNLTRTTDSMTWLGDITALVRDGGTVSLAFVPEYRPPTAFGPGMLVRVAEIGTEATGSVEEGDDPSPTTTAAAPSPTPDDAPGAPAPDPATPSPTLGSAGTPTPVPSSTPSAGPPTTASVSDAEPVAPEDDFFTLGPVAERSAETKPWARLLLLVPLSAAVGLGSARIRRVVSERTQLAGSV